jgi:protein O-mannosyl-transferase
MAVRSSAPDDHAPRKSYAAAGALLIIGIIALAYIPALKAGFVWDDDSMLTGNLVLQPNGLYRSWFTTEQLNYWPITWTSYWLEHLLWKENPTGYHATNILIHALCVLLLWRILVRLKIPMALPISLIFAVHPVNVESVAWVAQRKTILSMLFFLSSLAAYLKFDRTNQRRWYWASVGLFVLAVLSKGTVVALPMVILMCVWWLRRSIKRLDVVRSLPFFAISAVSSILEIWFQYNKAIGTDIVRTDSLAARIAGAGTAVWFYISKALVPVHLVFIYPRWQIDPTKWFSWIPDIALLAVFALSWRFRARWGRPILFALGYFIVMLLPILGLLNTYFMRYSLVADHYQYAGMIGVIALATVGVSRFVTRLNKSATDVPK